MDRLRTSPFRPEDYDAVLSDMDGVLIFGRRAAPGAVDFVRRCADRLYLVTNESARDPLQLTQDLNACGIDILPERIVTAGTFAIERLRTESPDACILIRGAPALHEMAAQACLSVWRPGDSADIVLLGRDPGFDIPALESMVRAVEDGAAIWVTNPDLRHPIGDGRHAFQTGALLAAFTACVGDVPVRVLGKPEPGLFLDALCRADVQPGRAVMLGDNPATDIVGAGAAGVPAILLGNAEEARAPHLAALLGEAD